jgi:tetratricopeptide (TPR) repeat protein
VRSTAASKPAKRAPAVHKAKASTAAAGTSTTAASHTYDKGYKKWEKFDVDAALNNASDDEADDSNSPNPAEEDADAFNSEQPQTAAPISSTTAAPAAAVAAQAAPTPASIVGNVPRRVTAPVPRALPRPAGLDPELEERERGNAHFKAGSFAAAVKCYTRCLAMNPRSVAALSNRAMAQLKLGEHRSAERDCSAALAAEPQHTKSLRRRAAARAALGKHRAALADLQLAVSLEPSSKELQTEAARCREVMRSALKRCPKKRVPIQLEVLPAVQCSSSNSSATAAVGPSIAPAVAAVCEPQSALAAVDEQAAVTVDAGATTDDDAAMRLVADSSRSAVNSEDIVLADGSGDSSTAAAVLSVVSSSAIAGIATKPKLPTAPPKTAYELEKEWRNLRDHPDLLCAYVHSFKSSTFKRVFRESLHADVVSGLLKLLQQHITPQQPAEAVRILLSLSKADGFSMLLLMLPAEDKATLHSVFELLQQQLGAAPLCALRATYKMQ